MPPLGDKGDAKLVSSVANNSGIGFIGSSLGFQDSNFLKFKNYEIKELENLMHKVRSLAYNDKHIGIGLICENFDSNEKSLNSILSLYPKNIWFSGYDFERFCDFTRQKKPDIKIFLQVRSSYSNKIILL